MINPRRNGDCPKAIAAETNPGPDEEPGLSAPNIAQPGAAINSGRFELMLKTVVIAQLKLWTRSRYIEIPFRHALIAVHLQCPKAGVQDLLLDGVKVGARRWVSLFSSN